MNRSGIAAMALLSSAVAWAGEKPEQFMVWGSRAVTDAYLADPGIAGTAELKPAPTKTEKSLGYAVLSGPAFALSGSGDLSATLPRCATLDVKDCPGQYGPLVFWIHSIKEGEYVIAAGDLSGPGGRTIPAGNLDVRVVRSVALTKDGRKEVVPLLLESFDRVRVSANARARFWVTYSIPADAGPGMYTGKLRITRNGGYASALPVSIGVYPFKLAEPDICFYIYHEDPDTPAELARWLADQRLHGMNMGLVSVPVTREGDLKLDELRVKLDEYARAGFPRKLIHLDLWNRITAEWLNDPDKTIGMWGPWFRYYPFSDDLDRRFVSAVKTIRDECRARGMEPIIESGDEAGSHDWTIPAVRHYNELLKKEVPDVIRELTVGGGWAGGIPEHERFKGLLNIWTTNRWLPDKLEIVRRDDPKAVIQLYNMAGPGSGPGGVLAPRALYGFYGWKAKVGGVTQWVYHHPGTPEHNYAWPAGASKAGASPASLDSGASKAGASPASLDSGGGMVPTIRWEAVREGVKDRRYVATLERMLAAKNGPAAGAGKANAPPASPAVDEARALLDSIAAKIELKHEDYDPVSGGRIPAAAPGVYEEWRAGIAAAIVRLLRE